jgi:hypothetical protein
LPGVIGLSTQQFDIGQLLARVRECRRIHLRVRLRNETFQQRSGTSDIFERAIDIRQGEHDLTCEFRLIVHFAKRAPSAAVDHALRGCGLCAAVGDRGAKQASQIVAHRLLARNVATRDVPFNGGAMRLPGGNAPSDRQDNEY